MDVFELIRRHEGERLRPYCDKCGKDLQLQAHGWGCDCTAALRPPGNITIGVGRNLTARGIQANESQGFLSDDVAKVLLHLHLQNLPWYSRLGGVRQAVMIDVCFACGPSGFDEFVDLKAAMAAGLYFDAANALRKSDWHAKKPKRPEELARMLETGQWPQGPY